MASMLELVERGYKLAEKYTIDELKNALRDALSMNNNEERLALQWALKKKTGIKNGYSFTKEQEFKMRTTLPV